MADINGDGRPDYIRFVDRGNGRFAPCAALFGNNKFEGNRCFPTVSAADMGSSIVRFADQNGDGKEGLISLEGGQVQVTQARPDPAGKLISMANGNSSVDIEYSRSTTLGLVNRDTDSGPPGNKFIADTT